ncbi:MAG: Ran-binding zinc finger domain-containing protein, partial [Candidatus Thermoplasmatota archaeon]|nr:Ran-binding zinc finger domain-containing protein [Candidatus Thermoplasmatota archaeon]
VGLIPGYLLYKRVVTVRGHEWHRLQALKKLSKHYKNEDSGSWEQDNSFKLHTTEGSADVGPLTQKALEKMQGKIGDLMMDNQEARTEIDTNAEISLLSDRDHVNLAAARMRGDTTLEDKSKKVTVADREKKSLMDKVLDWTALKLSKKDKAPPKIDVVINNNLNVSENIQEISGGASEYDSMVANSWHCRDCGNMNSIDSNYCEVCGSSK